MVSSKIIMLYSEIILVHSYTAEPRLLGPQQVRIIEI